MKFIKNADTINHTWQGQLVTPGSYYQIQNVELGLFANNTQLLMDIVTGVAVVAKSDDGLNDLTDINLGVNYLKDIQNQDSEGNNFIRLKAFSSTDGLHFRGTGLKDTIPFGTTKNIDYKLTENRYINGVEFILKDHQWNDDALFQVIDIDNILGFGAGLVLDEFGTNWNFSTDTQKQGAYLLDYPALIKKDLYIRIVYKSTGSVDNVSFKANLFLHKLPV